jgi:hypothetical protein
MIQPDDLAVANLKYILLCFESMSGLRINFHKSEVMVLGVEEEEGLRIAHMLIASKDPPLSPTWAFRSVTEL